MNLNLVSYSEPSLGLRVSVSGGSAADTVPCFRYSVDASPGEDEPLRKDQEELSHHTIDEEFSAMSYLRQSVHGMSTNAPTPLSSSYVAWATLVYGETLAQTH